ncbi:MAG TPA: hypothetical protein VJC03_04085, partial [bacterium]|nr:hypothetical protein [bacterium]
MKKGLFFSLLPVFLFLSPGIFSSRVYFQGDLGSLFHPLKKLTVENLISGEFPVWNPYVHGGMPLLANLQSQVLYPSSLLFALFPYPAALKLFYFVHLFLACFACFLLSRNLFLGLLAAFSG